MKETNQLMVPDVLELPQDTNTALCTAYNAIVCELKELLHSYPAEYRTYIKFNETEPNHTIKSIFLNPIVTIHLFDAYGELHLAYTRHPAKGYLNGKQWLAITRCILKLSSKEHTELDIEEYVAEYQHPGLTYEMAAQFFNEGDTRYQPISIKANFEEAPERELDDDDLPF